MAGQVPYMHTFVGAPRQHKVQLRNPQASVSDAVTTPSTTRHERFTPPCVVCRYPLMAGDDGCPRCAIPDWSVH